MDSGQIKRHGLTFPPDTPSLDIEIYCYNRATPESKPLHFKNIVLHYWGPKHRVPFTWNPCNERMLIHACRHKFLSLSGGASLGKTSFLAMWAIVNWMCNPETTKVLCTSTTLKDSRRRIWGKIESYFDGAGKNEYGTASVLPGKLASSFGIIRSIDSEGEEMSPLCGIELIAGDSAKERENIGKIIGVHNEHVFFLCDEMPELSPALTHAAESNLSVNTHFQMISSGNFASVYDPFGVKSTPKAGWGSVTPDDDEWETEDGGYCLRFDALKSPNITEGRVVYKGLYSLKDLEEHKRTLGEHSAAFWRMCRSFPCQDADTDRIFSEADFVKGDVHGVVKWTQPPTKVAALDPAFATGGDRAIAYFGLLGMATTGRMTLQFTERKEYREDVRIKDQNRATQVAKQFAADCIAKEISAQHAAYDASGGGIVFGSLLAEIWSPKLVGIQFGGSASNLPVSSKDRRPGKEGFANRIAEIWFAGVDYVISGQIKGLFREAAKEMIERRRIREQKGASGLKLRVESKSDMRERIGRSCDDADAALILLCLCRENLGFMPVGLEMKHDKQRASWAERARKVNGFYSKANYGVEELAA